MGEVGRFTRDDISVYFIGGSGRRAAARIPARMPVDRAPAGGVC
jgi:hypothetical protein